MLEPVAFSGDKPDCHNNSCWIQCSECKSASNSHSSTSHPGHEHARTTSPGQGCEKLQCSSACRHQHDGHSAAHATVAGVARQLQKGRDCGALFWRYAAVPELRVLEKPCPYEVACIPVQRARQLSWHAWHQSFRESCAAVAQCVANRQAWVIVCSVKYCARNEGSLPPRIARSGCKSAV